MNVDMKYVHTVLAAADKAKNKAERIEILQKYKSQGLLDVLYCQYNDKIEFDLPEGAPPYTPFDTSKQLPKQLSKIGPKLLKFLIKNGPGRDWPAIKREKKFLDILEMIHPKDAEVLIAAKDKELKESYPKITKNVVTDAFPNLL